MSDKGRIGEIGSLLDVEGRRLLLVQNEDGWEAIFPIRGFGSTAPAARGATRLAATEAAWVMYQTEPHLGRSEPKT